VEAEERREAEKIAAHYGDLFSDWAKKL